MRIGVLGGGQLGRMLALAGIPLGHRFVFLDPSPEAPAAAVGDLILGDYTDPAGLDQLLRASDAVTFEFENVPAEALAVIAGSASVPVRPCVEALRTGQDRLLEKTLFREVGLAVPRFATAGTPGEFAAAVAEVGGWDGPEAARGCIAKTRRMGYDGKGQAVLRSRAAAEVDRAWATVRTPHGVLVESLVRFSRELSILAVRSAGGETAAYPLVENVHIGGILRRSTAPAAGVPAEVQRTAAGHAAAVMDRLGYAGVLAIEFFEEGGGGGLLGNEMAPRVHNSGHWTIEGSVCSQFENHVRAVAGHALGSTAMASPVAVMLNLVGTEEAAARRALAVPGAHLHWYGKDPRPGRKVGHITVLAEDHGRAAGAAAAVEEAVGAGCGLRV